VAVEVGAAGPYPPEKAGESSRVTTNDLPASAPPPAGEVDGERVEPSAVPLGSVVVTMRVDLVRGRGLRWAEGGGGGGGGLNDGVQGCSARGETAGWEVAMDNIAEWASLRGANGRCVTVQHVTVGDDAEEGWAGRWANLQMRHDG
jgi:hypothetical protein